MSQATRAERSEAAEMGTSHLEAFFGAVRDSNPVKANRVTEPSPYDVDVTTIHAASFDRLLALADQARRERKGIGAVLLGGAGIGKSHLLSRLYRWSVERVERDHPRAYYVYLNNILADPERLPRYLLKCVVSILSEHGRGRFHESPLFQLVNHAVWDALKGAGVNSANLKEGGNRSTAGPNTRRLRPSHGCRGRRSTRRPPGPSA
jgi:hypothetical protein